MATRVQAQYAPRGTGLERVTARPVATEQAQFNTPQEDSATRLARALGALDANVIGGALQRTQNVDDAEERRRAQAYANSVTLDELGKQIRDGQMLPSQSPVFAATVQHIYGENSQKALERDTLSKLSTGELKFATEQELDEYLTNARNEYLTGQSGYTTAGFDKGWNQFRGQVLAANTKVNNAAAVDRGVAEASDNLSNVLLDVTAPTFQGSDEDRAKALMGRYELLTTTQLLREDSRKAALGDVMTRIATTGNTALLQTMLNQKTPGNGPTIAGVLGGSATATLVRTSEVIADRTQREALRQANINAANAITATAQFQAGLLVDSMRGYELPDFTIPTPDGGTKTVKGKDVVGAVVAQKVAANPSMSLPDQVRLYSNNAVENKAWKGALTAAVNNIGEVGVDANGKPVGQLLPGTVQALDLFSQINQVSTGYAEEMAGGGDNYQTLVNIQALREAGVNDPNLAASLVDQAKRNTAKNIESITTQVRSAVNQVTDPGMFTGRFWSEVLSGEWGEGTKNVRAMEGAISSLAKAYMAAGIVASGDDAVRMAMEYYANPAVTTQINNTVYLNKDLPRVPEGQDQRFWMQRFFDEQVADDLKSMGIDYNKDDIYLHPMRGGEGRFMLHLNGTPLGKVYLRRDMESWINNRDNQDISDRIAQKQRQPRPDAFIQDETPGGAAIIFRNPRR